MKADPRLIVALDAPNVATAAKWVETLGDSVAFYKVGMELVYAGGLPFASDLIKSGKQVFIDLKLHDIPETVQRATAQIAGLGAAFLTVHAYPQTMRAASAGAAGSSLGILAVSVLTSSDDSDLAEAGYALGVKALVARRAAQAAAIGVAGLVCSAAEAGAIKGLVGERLKLVTPGIRPADSDSGDQKRIATPAGALRAGADYLVVGRPITRAPDQRAAAMAIVEEMAGAL